MGFICTLGRSPHYDGAWFVRPALPNLYFAYAAPQSLVALPPGARAPEVPSLKRVGKLAQAKNVDLVFDRPSAAWKGRIASLRKEAGRTVYGSLWEVRASDWPRLEALEAAMGGEVEGWTVEVEAEGKLHKATAYAVRAGARDTQGTISTAYFRELIRQLEELGAPEPYLLQSRAELGIVERMERVKQQHHLP